MMKRKYRSFQWGRVILISLVIQCALLPSQLDAQPQPKIYTVRDGRMHIELGKQLTEASLDSFIKQFNLSELALKEFIRVNFTDSIIKAGWIINENTNDLLIITKPLVGFDHKLNSAELIRFTGKEPSLATRFPVVSQGILYGINWFQNKQPFSTTDSTMTFFLRGHTKADKVILSGSFVNWSPEAIHMTRTDNGWIAKLNLRPGKYWYKFIIDGNWQTDEDNLLTENDGLGNTNSVVFKTNTIFRFNPSKNVKQVWLAGSFNEWRTDNLPMTKSDQGWELPLYLAEGTHTYRFVADGEWYTDPENPDRLPNEFDDHNSVIRIGKPVIFRLDGYAGARQVFLTGTFNGWRENELLMNKTSSGWELPHTLGPGNFQYNYIIDGKELSNTPELMIIEPNYTFRLKGFAQAKTVYLAGDFNNWDPRSMAMKKEGDDWVFTVHLSPGKHLYKFIVDGKWIIDPGNQLWEENEYETGNSILWFEK